MNATPPRRCDIDSPTFVAEPRVPSAEFQLVFAPFSRAELTCGSPAARRSDPQTAVLIFGAIRRPAARVPAAFKLERAACGLANTAGLRHMAFAQRC
ncbi:hypothetical protein SRHO_G00015970 [Serrasalmus rhombeus]